MTGDGTLWVQIRMGLSWHIVGTYSRTRCGRMALVNLATNDLPPNEKSCETCLRLDMRDREKLA